MTIEKTVNGEKVVLAVSGRLDTVTAPQLEAEIKNCAEGLTALELDFVNLAYISSAGLRVLLSTQKMMNKQGEMVITHVNDDIMEIFEMTGFADILTIQ